MRRAVSSAVVQAGLLRVPGDAELNWTGGSWVISAGGMVIEPGVPISLPQIPPRDPQRPFKTVQTTFVGEPGCWAPEQFTLPPLREIVEMRQASEPFINDWNLKRYSRKTLRLLRSELLAWGVPVLERRYDRPAVKTAIFALEEEARGSAGRLLRWVAADEKRWLEVTSSRLEPELTLVRIGTTTRLGATEKNHNGRTLHNLLLLLGIPSFRSSERVVEPRITGLPVRSLEATWKREVGQMRLHLRPSP